MYVSSLKSALVLLLVQYGAARSILDKNEKLLDNNSTVDKSLTLQCSQFVRNCIDFCEEKEIETFAANCSSEDAVCHCNKEDYSSIILSSMLKDMDEKEEEEEEEQETNQQVNRLQFSDEEELAYQNMEYVYPNQELTKNLTFQKGFCSKYLIRCKQDCPAAFSSYYCDVNREQTGFLLSCVCNGVDIAASVNTQVQAETNEEDY